VTAPKLVLNLKISGFWGLGKFWWGIKTDCVGVEDGLKIAYIAYNSKIKSKFLPIFMFSSVIPMDYSITLQNCI